MENFTAVKLPITAETNAAVTVRLVYSPISFQAGLFFSFLSGVLLAFLGVLFGSRVFSGRGKSKGVHAVARNSVAPIILNLFNRGIDFAFALVMLRLLAQKGRACTPTRFRSSVGSTSSPTSA